MDSKQLERMWSEGNCLFNAAVKTSCSMERFVGSSLNVSNSPLNMVKILSKKVSLH